MNKNQIGVIKSIISNSSTNLVSVFDEHIENIEIIEVINNHVDYFTRTYPDLCAKILKELFLNKKLFLNNIENVLFELINKETGFDVLKPISLIKNIREDLKNKLKLRENEFINQIILENKKSIDYDSFKYQIDNWSGNINENIIKLSKILNRYYDILKIDLEKALVFFVDNCEVFKIDVPKILKEKNNV